MNFVAVCKFILTSEEIFHFDLFFFAPFSFTFEHVDIVTLCVQRRVS